MTEPNHILPASQLTNPRQGNHGGPRQKAESIGVLLTLVLLVACGIWGGIGLIDRLDQRDLSKPVDLQVIADLKPGSCVFAGVASALNDSARITEPLLGSDLREIRIRCLEEQKQQLVDASNQPTGAARQRAALPHRFGTP